MPGDANPAGFVAIMIRRLANSPLTRLFSTSVIDQAVLSAGNFLVGVLLIRYAPDTQYGLYVLAFSGVQLAVAAQGAWVGGPLMFLAPKRSREAKLQLISGAEADQGRLLRRLAAIAAPLPFLATTLGLLSPAQAWVATATVFAGWMALRREFIRSVLFILSRPQSALYADIVYVCCLLALVGLSLFVSPAAAATAVVGLGAAAAVGRWMGHRAIARNEGWIPNPGSANWAEMRHLATWATAGAVVYWIYGQSYNFVLAHRADLSAVAEVNVARLLLMPLMLMSQGVSNILNPNASGWLHHEGLPRVIRRLVPFALGLLVILAVYVGVLWQCRHWLMAEVMRKQIVEIDTMLLLWAFTYTLSMLRDVFQSALIALGRFKIMAGLTAIAAVGSLSAMWFCIGRFGPAGAIMGVIVGETLSLGGVVFLLIQSLRRHDRAPLSSEVPVPPPSGV